MKRDIIIPEHEVRLMPISPTWRMACSQCERHYHFARFYPGEAATWGEWRPPGKEVWETDATWGDWIDPAPFKFYNTILIYDGTLDIVLTLLAIAAGREDESSPWLDEYRRIAKKGLNYYERLQAWSEWLRIVPFSETMPCFHCRKPCEIELYKELSLAYFVDILSAVNKKAELAKEFGSHKIDYDQGSTFQ